MGTKTKFQDEDTINSFKSSLVIFAKDTRYRVMSTQNIRRILMLKKDKLFYWPSSENDHLKMKNTNVDREEKRIIFTHPLRARIL